MVRSASAWLAMLTVAFGCIDSTLPTALGGGGAGGAPTTGSVQVMVGTSGANPDSNGYQLVIDENTSQPVSANGGVTFTGLEPGAYQVSLNDVAGNCVVGGSGATRGFTIAAGSTTMVAFDVDCS